ncbi:MAG TPA: carboxypeptidase-like regulatory domain-containing protein [Thermoanaerobaculia bacterium]|nr:carboxypeptidase-like regulatory domain-containing protein [Thermoanaerobaculia bacterium]
MGKVSGVVRIQDQGAPLPRQVLVKTLAVPSVLKRPPAPQGAVDCPVDKKGAWSCSLPASVFDLVVSADGFTPQYRWGVKILPDKTVAVGTVELQRGASVAGWVTVEGGRIDPEQCIVRLSSLSAGGADARKAIDLERVALERKVGKDGFFQLTSLAPGMYAVEVRQPGYAPARVDSVRVEPRTETFLGEPLVLTRLLDLQFQIDPAVDWLGRPWRAQVVRADGAARPRPVIFDGVADPEGLFTAPGQSPGLYEVTVLDSLGNRFHREPALAIGPGDGRQTIEVSLVDLEGRLRLGSNSLAATLWFGGRSGTMSIRMEADEEGRFLGVLPHEGLWWIDVEAEEPRFRVRIRSEVKADRSGKSRLTLDLPDTRVFGRVVDEEGRPVEAHLFLQGEGLDLFQSTEPDGTFDLRGLNEGALWLSAESSSRTSGRTFAPLTEGRAVGPLELKIRPTRRLTGTVASSLGPVAGSQVDLLAILPMDAGSSATTDTAGSFSAELPEGVQRVAAIVSAPGFALRAYDLPAESPLALRVSEESGGLEIILPEEPEELQRRNLVPVVFQNGLSIPIGLLRRWAHDQGQLWGAEPTLRIPNVAPGEYRVCFLPRQLELLNPGGMAPQPAGACDAGVLSPGAILLLKPSFQGSP